MIGFGLSLPATIVRQPVRPSGGSMPALAAITGERPSGGVHLGFDNATGFDQTSSRGITLPALAFKVSATLPWTLFVEIMTGSAASPNGTSIGREQIATLGTSTTVNLGSSLNGYLYRYGRKLFFNRNTANVSTQGSFLMAANAPVDLGITLEDHTAYLIAISQDGNLGIVRVVNLDTLAVQTYTGPDNKSVFPSFYKDSTGATRAATNFDNFFAALGTWTAGATYRQGFAGVIGAVANSWSNYTNAELQAIASGAVSFGSLTNLQYWNKMFLVGTALAAETVDLAGNAITTTTAAVLTIQGTALSASVRPHGAFRTGALIKSQREVGPYTFPIMSGRTTGRVYFEGVNSAPAGYAIYGRLGSAPGLADVLAATQLSAAHAGGAFRFTRDGIAPSVTFYRSYWVGPATSTPFGADGHTYDERILMQIGVRSLYLHQSQGSKQADSTVSISTAGGTGGTLTPAAASGGWLMLSYGSAQTAFTATAPITGANSAIGPRELTITATTGDGLTAKLNRIAALTGMAVHEAFAPRAGHSLDAFVFDRITVTAPVTGAGTTRTAQLDMRTSGVAGVDAVAIVGGMLGVEPGSVIVTTANFGVLTDVANAALTGLALQSAANPQAFPAAAGLTGTCTINYYAGAFTLNFTGDPGVTTVSYKTRFDSTDATNATETTPDKFTLFGDTVLNGNIRKIMAITPRHGFTCIYWGGMTSNVNSFVQSTEAGYLAARDTYAAKLDALIARLWPLCDGTNPPLIVGFYGRASGKAENNNARRARRELAFFKPYNPAAASDGSSGATAANYRWWGGFTSQSLSTNLSEHQDSKDIGGILVGEQEALAVVSLVKGNQALARGPEFLSARIKPGFPDIIEVIPTYFRTGATALMVDTARGGATTNLPDWHVDVNPAGLLAGSEELTTVNLNGATGYVEIMKTTAAGNGVSAGAWPAIPANVLRVRHKPYSIMMYLDGGNATTDNPSVTAAQAADELKLASRLHDNSGGYGGIAPGAETLPIFGLNVT